MEAILILAAIYVAYRMGRIDERHRQSMQRAGELADAYDRASQEARKHG